MGATRFNKFTQFNAQAVTGVNTYHSPDTNINQQHNIGIQIRFVGTMVGTLIVECSNGNVGGDPDPDTGLPWDFLTFDPVLAQPTGTDLSYLIDLNQVPFKYVRTTYSNTAGTGTLTAVLTSKDLS